MKGFHVPSTRTTNSVLLILGSQYSLLHQTSPSALRAETSSRYQLASHAGVFRGARFSSLYEKRAPLKTPAWEARYQTDLPENQIWRTDEAGASLACYQSTLISGTSFSANGISLRLGEVQMKFYERSLQALLSPAPAPRGFAARSRVLARLPSLAQMGELARR